MPYTFTRTIIEQVEIEEIKRNFMTYRVFCATRIERSNCAMCDHTFDANEVVHLALARKQSHMIICESCANIALANGAKQQFWQEA